jgi:hypothetical protein
MVFVAWDCMFLTPPTVEELKQSDLSELIEMLAKQSEEYTRLLRSEGASFKTNAIKEMIVNIQDAIDAKKVSKKPATSK